MRRCLANVQHGRRCLNAPLPGSRLCHAHQDRVDGRRAAWVGVGTAVGSLVVPGIGGAGGGALVGYLVDKLTVDEPDSKTRVFVSFDFDNDRALKDFVIGQAKLEDSPFSVVDCSLKEAAPTKTWEEHARKAIKTADLVLVIVGRQTYRASGVLKEVAMARAAGVRIVQMVGYKTGTCPPVPNAGRLYRWSWKNLKRLLS